MYLNISLTLICQDVIRRRKWCKRSFSLPLSCSGTNVCKDLLAATESYSRNGQKHNRLKEV